jgi:hypothetical protein
MKYIFKDNTYFAKPKDDPKDRIEVEIGDSKEPGVILPQEKICRWDNESNVSIRLLGFDEYSVFQDKEKVIFGNEKQEVHIYPITEGEGGQEFEVILKEKPASNILQFSLIDKDVEYFYQPALNQEQLPPNGVTATETDVFDKDGNIIAHRPENVVGSYVVYAKSNKINYVGGKEYKCGKVGHIFRPIIIDSAGKEAWGELHIENGVLSVTIPQEFLDKAVYPVRHAAGLTFGYTSIGGTLASSNGRIKNAYYGVLAAPASDGTVTNFTIYLDSYGSSTPLNLKGVIYNEDGSALVGYTYENALSAGFSKGWKSSDIASGGSVTTQNYAVVGWGNNNCWLYYDNAGGTTKYTLEGAVQYAETPPSSVSFRSGTNTNYSIYCTYEAGGGGETAVIPTRLLMGVGG